MNKSWVNIQKNVDHYFMLGKPEPVLNDIMIGLAPAINHIAKRKYWQSSGAHEDISQTAQIQVMEFLRNSEKKPKSIEQICYTIIKRKFIDYMRKVNRNREVAVDETQEENLGLNNPWQSMDAREKLRIILEFGRTKCSRDHFKIILMLWKLGYTQAEVARKLDMKAATVQSIERRFKEKVMSYLEKRGFI